MRTYLRKLLADPLFMRVCMFLWGLPFASLGGYGVLALRPTDLFEWFALLLLLGLLTLGAYLIFTALFRSDSAVDSSTEWISDGGEILGFVLALVVMLVALPLTAIIRTVRARE